MHYRRATLEEGADSSFQGTVSATYSDLVRLFGEPRTDHGPKVLAYWGVQFDDGTFASVYLWKLPSIPHGIHDWHVGGHSPRALESVSEALANLPPAPPDGVDQILPPPPAHPPWTKKDRALNRACATGDAPAAEVMIAAGADVDSRSPDIDGGNVPLEEAIEKGHYNVIEMLLAAGADVNARRGSGQVPLHRAAILGDEKTVQLLLDNGADTRAADYFGTAADWARRFKREHIANLIESQAGAGC
jgi:hypothetical protein